ncbi:MAG: hypothetical protein V7722_01560, partial [Porticoccus sp.]
MSAPHIPIECTLQQLLTGMPLSQIQAELPVAGLCLDSRLVKQGDVFIAVPGGAQDGRDYIA